MLLRYLIFHHTVNLEVLMKNVQNTLLALLLANAFSLSYAANPLDKLSQEADKLQNQAKERAHVHDRPQHPTLSNQGSQCRDERRLRSEQGNVKTRLKFINKRQEEVRTYWLDYNGQRVLYKAIAPGAEYTQPTYQTHPWVVTDKQNKCIDIFISKRRSATAEIR